MDGKETGCEGEGLIHEAQDLVSMVTIMGTFRLGEELVAFQEGICFVTDVM